MNDIEDLYLDLMLFTKSMSFIKVTIMNDII